MSATCYTTQETKLRARKQTRNSDPADISEHMLEINTLLSNIYQPLFIFSVII